jgi:hypothetical protein
VLASVVAAATACAPSGRDIRLERLDAERRSLEATFDHLATRLTVNQARVRFWNEMRSRHESASAIACASLEQHANEMAARGHAPGQASLQQSRVAVAGRSPSRSPASRE